MGKYTNLENQIFGYWTVIKKTIYFSRKFNYKYNCKCECGKIRDIAAQTLISGKSKSCGCKIIFHLMKYNNSLPQKLCSINDCGCKHFGLGYCRRHHNSFRKYGDPLKVGLKKRVPYNKEKSILKRKEVKKRYKKTDKGKVSNSKYLQGKGKELYRDIVRNRRNKIKIATPKWVNKSDIIKFIKNKPDNMTIDHILPIKSKFVSGLHVPWNLQYLTLEENLKKNNSFDFTMENESWKNAL